MLPIDNTLYTPALRWKKGWYVPRGGEPTKDHDGSIHTVAQRVIDRGGFMGETFSAGDEFIALCAERSEIGNGSTWRRVNMVHHMTLAADDVANLIGRPFERPKRAPVPRQLSLLPAVQGVGSIVGANNPNLLAEHRNDSED
jgi:hypothetical protein